jgi:type VI secretion system protein ImpM
MPGAALIPPGGPCRAGCYGKLPARGDFVRAGLSRRFTDPWDAWVQSVLPASRGILGSGWVAAWLAAPVWRFRLAAGVCGPDPVVGVWLASVDGVGRYFPLVLARTGPGGPGFLAAAERIGLAAVAGDVSPDEVAARLRLAADADTLPGEATAAASLWWTGDAPRRPHAVLGLPALPDARTFAAMLDATNEVTP